MTRRTLVWQVVVLFTLLAAVKRSTPHLLATLVSDQHFLFVNGTDDIHVRPHDFTHVLVARLPVPYELVSDDVRVSEALLVGGAEVKFAAWIEAEQLQQISSANGTSKRWLLEDLVRLVKPKNAFADLTLMLRHWMLQHLPWFRARTSLVAVLAFRQPQQVVQPPQIVVQYEMDERCTLSGKEEAAFYGSPLCNDCDDFVICRFRQLPECEGRPPCSTSCDFERSCSWQWKNNTTPPGFNVVSGKLVNNSLLSAPVGNFTGPLKDSANSSEGHFLFVLITEAHPASQREVHLMSPKFFGSGDQCKLEFDASMARMLGGNLKVVVETVNRTSWVVSEKQCDDLNLWKHFSINLGRISQEFHVLIEVTPGKKTPAYFAIDNLKFVDCFRTFGERKECTGMEFRCSNEACIDRSRICDLVKDCLEGEDEEFECDKLPVNSRCNFESGLCGWRNVGNKELNWTRHSGKTPTNLTGPSVDHTYNNSSGNYLFVDMSKVKHLGATAILESDVFRAPPKYHSNIHSPYFNSCQIRFHFHMYGPHSGALALFLVDVQSGQRIHEARWYSYGDRGDKWVRAIYNLSLNVEKRYAIQFEARRGYSSKGDIAIDDISMSPECFGLGVPPNETENYNYWDENYLEPTQPTTEHEDFSNQTYYHFGSCGSSGRLGPSPEQCTLAYNGSSTNITVLTEPPLSGVQKWIAPHEGFYTIIAKGASGGRGSSGQGISRGAVVRAVVELRKGEPLYILVGQQGSRATCKDGRPAHGGSCAPPRLPSKTTGIARDAVREVRNMTVIGGGGGGGGATYIFTIGRKNRQKMPLIVAGGGGGISHGQDLMTAQLQHGQGFNLSMGNSSGMEYGLHPAGAGGGWQSHSDSHSVVRGAAFLDGAFGGDPCSSTMPVGAGGFGGGGGGCTAGGGGGGFAGGDTWSDRRRSGRGGSSMVRQGLLLARAGITTSDGDGSVIIIPSLSNACHCDYRCVAMDEFRHETKCLCPSNWFLGNDSFSCFPMNEAQSYLSTSYLATFLVVACGILLFVGVGCMIMYARYQKKKTAMRRRKLLSGPDFQLNRLRAASGGMMTEYNPNYEFGGGTYTIQDLKEIPREHLRLVTPLGQGAFGEVYKGFYKTRANDAVEMPVAVKTLPELSTSQSEMDFLMEALIMSKFNHPNIVHFIGVCFDSHPRFIILELLAGGDLKNFLRESRPKPERPSILTMKDLLMCAIDVAKGCKYMEDNHFIHRDIASRNCLLTSKGPGRVVKIADFGMARDIYRADYYRKGGKAMLPVKWMPPEAFLDGIFTSKTDVWSFGVLLWEVMSLGYMPYTGRGNQEVMQLVTDGGRLEPPNGCPAPVYGLMTQCWHPIPDDRPNFSTILERIGYCIQDPDVVNAPLPVFHRPPSTERDTTVMRPPAHDATLLHLQKGPGGEFLLPSDSVEMHASPSGGSAEHLLGSGAYGLTNSNSFETSFSRDATNYSEDEGEMDYEEAIKSSNRSLLSSRHHIHNELPPLSAAPPPPSSDAEVPVGIPSMSSSLDSLDNAQNNNLSSCGSMHEAAMDLYVKSKLPLQGSLSLDPSTLSRTHSHIVLPPPIQYANVSPNSGGSSSEQLQVTPEHRKPYSVQTTPKPRRLLKDNEISC
ncbi:tyrosine-protein kinase receptor-like [Neocloeon triangulifer]|uniref:tyrosine-protein kinase receptor-like n=1 Tax=Neocloeon triangulifer TaxID=2078957 RepID=UPI00286EFD87|nr:tyrosine-protein kinase receptor-like [Neocloeon triangulifer]